MSRLRAGFSGLQRQIGSFGLLTLALLLMMLIRPFLDEDGEGGLLTDLLFLGTFLAGIYAVRRQRYNYRLAIGIASVSLVGRVHLHLSDAELIPIVVSLSSLLFLLHALVNVAGYIWTERRRVTHDVIFAAVCAYLLLGFVWAYVYEFLAMGMPDSFHGPVATLNRDDFTYFSFVTLATLGYGDIVPMSRPARALAVIEAVSGQLYLAILISRLVGAHVGQLQKAAPAPRTDPHRHDAP